MVTASSTCVAQVRTPNGPWFVSQAVNYHGFLVQERRYGVGAVKAGRELAEKPLTWGDYEEYADYWRPFLHPQLAQAAGVDAAMVEQDLRRYGNRIFELSSHCSLFLRWGNNAQGYYVEPVLEPEWTADTAELVALTPHTCWKTGQTYYQFSSLLTGYEVHCMLLPAEKHLLPSHTQEQGEEGEWPGYYTTDLPRLQQLLAREGKRAVLAQEHTTYYVMTVVDPSQQRFTDSVQHFATREEAQHCFDQLPTATDEAIQATAFPRARLCSTQVLLGKIEFIYNHAEKRLPPLGLPYYPFMDYTKPDYLKPSTGPAEGSLAAMQAIRDSTALAQAPKATQSALAQYLGMTVVTLQKRQREPETWRLHELQRLATLQQVPLPEVVEGFCASAPEQAVKQQGRRSKK
ncbi:hypothetical protein H8B15_19960 [Hymenobacter sp. BT507]|uniref:XRE family transcriptional regulator n=1 Tax=Hymenobacter citatus TaxID=2763506 RepID=A0ABR7MQ69_9BACT|nr:hypothetical protein [Hymenobacter citatus]MBC6613207.1 hypothetical protein [Hymenobacter citatus]